MFAIGDQALTLDATTTPDTRFGAYLFAHGAWFLAFGVQGVLFTYLVRIVLQENAVRFGLAQMALQLPTTLLILFGGALADRINTRPLVTAACVAMVLGFSVLGILVTTGRLSYGILIGFALSVGTIGAFAQPARDSLLSLMAPDKGYGSIQHAVSLASLAQFGGQILGMMLATAAPLLGVGPLLYGQAALMAVAAVSTLQMRPRPREPKARSEHGNVVTRLLADIGGGFAAVARSPIMATVTVCAMAMGVCFMGSFFVLLPLMVQDYFPISTHGDNTKIATALGLFSLCFWVGSMISALILARVGGRLRRKGRAYLMALATGGVVLLLCSLRVPFWLFCGLNFIWGLGGGVAMTLGRGLIQEHAPPEARARVLSVFTLGLMGGGPLGAAADGVLAQALGPHVAILIPGTLMLLLVGSVAAFTQLGRTSEALAPT